MGEELESACDYPFTSPLNSEEFSGRDKSTQRGTDIPFQPHDSGLITSSFGDLAARCRNADCDLLGCDDV